jgi:hypothetical protein
VKEFFKAITCFNPKIIKSIVQGVPIFIIEKTMIEMFNLPKTSIAKLATKPTKEKDKEKEREKKATIFQKIVSPEALVNWERWN